MSGKIYCIANNINNKVYIGQTIQIMKRRFAGHCCSKYPVGKAIRKYGIENFTISILKEGNYTQEELNNFEIYYIKQYNSTHYKKGYNGTIGGNYNLITDATRKNMSIAAIGRKASPETRQKMSQNSKIRCNTPEFKEAIKNRMIGNKIMVGKKLSDETRLKQSISGKERLSKIPKEILQQRAIEASKTRLTNHPDIGDRISKSKKERDLVGWSNNQSNPVLQLTLDNIPIKLWSSAYQAQCECGYLNTHIRGVCLGNYGNKTYKNYKWKYVSEQEIKELNHLKDIVVPICIKAGKNKKVIQTDLNNNIIKEWNNSRRISEHYNLSIGYVSTIINKQKVFNNEYLFRFQ